MVWHDKLSLAIPFPSNVGLSCKGQISGTISLPLFTVAAGKRFNLCHHGNKMQISINPMKSLAYSEKAKFQERFNYRCIRWQPGKGSIFTARSIVNVIAFIIGGGIGFIGAILEHY